MLQWADTMARNRTIRPRDETMTAKPNDKVKVEGKLFPYAEPAATRRRIR